MQVLQSMMYCSPPLLRMMQVMLLLAVLRLWSSRAPSLAIHTTVAASSYYVCPPAMPPPAFNLHCVNGTTAARPAVELIKSAVLPIQPSHPYYQHALTPCISISISPCISISSCISTTASSIISPHYLLYVLLSRLYYRLPHPSTRQSYNIISYYY